MLLSNSVINSEGFRSTITNSAVSLNDPVVYRHRLRQLALKEQMLDTIGLAPEFANRLLPEIQRQYEDTDLPDLAGKLLDMRKKLEVLESFLATEYAQNRDQITPSTLSEKLTDLRRKEQTFEKLVQWPENDFQRFMNNCRREFKKHKENGTLFKVPGPDYPDQLIGYEGEREVLEAEDNKYFEMRAMQTNRDAGRGAPLPAMDKANYDAMEDYRKMSNAKLKKVVGANKTLQAKLRQVADNRNRWSKYAEHLEKKLEKSNALLKENKLAVPGVQKESTEEPEEGRPKTPERDIAGDVVLQPQEPNPFMQVPNLAETVLETAASSQQEVQAAVVAGHTSDTTQQGVQAGQDMEDMSQYDQNPKPLQTILDRLEPAPNGSFLRDGVEIPLMRAGYGKQPGYWKGKGKEKEKEKERGPVYSEDHPMAQGGLKISECSKDAQELLENIQPRNGWLVNDMTRALRTYKHPVPAPEPAVAGNNTQEDPISIADDVVQEQPADQPEKYAEFIAKLADYHEQRGTPFDPQPRVESKSVDLQKLYKAVIARGGCDKVSDEKLGWRQLAKDLKFEPNNLLAAAFQLKNVYYQFLAAYEIKNAREPPPKEIEEDVSVRGGGLLTRTIENFCPHDISRETSQLEMDMSDASKDDVTPAATPGPSTLGQNAIQPEPPSEPPSPKLPKLMRTTTVQDSLTSSSSLSAPHTSSTQAEHPTSSANTVNAAEANEANAAAAAAPAEDDEPPIVVSERQLRKRKPADFSPAKAKIKQERLESSSIAVLGLRHLQPQESMDLDEIGPKTATPKKRREKISVASLVGDGEDHAPANDRVYEHPPNFMATNWDEKYAMGMPRTPATSVERPSLTVTPALPPSATSVLKPRSTNATILPRTSAKLHSVKRRRVEDTERGAELFSEDGENHLAATDAEAVESPSRALSRSTATRLSNLLEKPSSRRWQVMNMDDEPDIGGNVAVGKEPTVTARQPTHQRLAAQRAAARKSDKSGWLQGIQLDSKPTWPRVNARDVERNGLIDGARLGTSPHRPKQGLPGHDSDDDLADLAKGGRRIGDKPVVPSTGERRSPASVLNAPYNTPPAAQKRPWGFKDSRGDRKTARENVSSTARPEEEPLSARPVSRLSLEDFRINPEYNNGLDYAYRDVVRGREKRQCLAGCTDPSCCGKGFRALAEIATPMRENPTSAQEEDETRLLKEFLGRDANRLLKHMGKEERRETLIKAKTRELANKHGKHRHAYERRKSPPGFWRADFPTTQEEMEDREEAREFERELVRKRYEEAMRGGGKWVFRD